MRRLSSGIWSWIAMLVLVTLQTVPVLAYTTNMNASMVICQPNLTSSSANAGAGSANARGCSYPAGIATDGIRLIVADNSNHRVLIFNSIPTQNFPAADVVIGQTNFTSNFADQDDSVAANTLDGPSGVATDGRRLFVADYNNSRVLIYNEIPRSNNTAADVVIGQPDMTTGGAGTTASKFNRPWNVDYDPQSGKLLISDYGNNRVLIYNQVPAVNGAAANVVVGQPDFTTSSIGLTSSKFSGPNAAKIISGKLFVAEQGNVRVLIWNSVPVTNGAAADVVIGQANFTTRDSNQGGSAGANTLTGGQDIHFDGKRLFVKDRSNSRILIFNELPSANNKSADAVLGQPNFTASSANQGGTANANTFNSLLDNGIINIGNKLIVSDTNNNRILVYDNLINTPQFGISSVNGRENGKLRLNGNMSLGDGLYSIWKLEASVNGGNYTPVSNLQSETFYPGTTKTAKASFYHDFSPWSMDNGSESDWKNKSNEMHEDRGYTVKFKGYTTNADTEEHFIYFTPFKIDLSQASPYPAWSTRSFLNFSVNKYQRRELKENLDFYEVWLKQGEQTNTSSAWQKYLSHIPIDYDLVRDYSDNLNKADVKLKRGEGEGIYENQYLIAKYTNKSSSISVRKKAATADTTNLEPGFYQVKATAVDKHQHTQDSLPITVKVTGSQQPQTQATDPNRWFPLQINKVSGAKLGIIASFNPDTWTTLDSTITTTTPTITGIAFSNAKVILTVTDTESDQSRTFETHAQNSSWTMTPTLYSHSNLDFQVTNTDNLYAELPTITLNFKANED